MRLWIEWFKCVRQLRDACSRYRTFLWMVTLLMAITIRCGDLAGVTSIIRVLGLKDYCYDRLLDFIHSTALDLNKLVSLWVKLILKLFASSLIKVQGRYVLVGDGIKVAKEGKKMPAVKSLHQGSESNTKPEYIMGHSCQSVAILATAGCGVFAIPLFSHIHEGLVFSNRCLRTLYDKLLQSINLMSFNSSYYFVADAYYAVVKMAEGLLKNGNHLITRVRKNAIAYLPAEPQKGKPQRGRPKRYGRKIKLNSLFGNLENFECFPSPIYGEKNVLLRAYAINLIWRPAGVLVKFIAVLHPQRGKILLMCTDLELATLEIIKLYGLRFKIEVSFKQALHTVGTYAYHFWMKSMKPIKRKSGDQHLHRETSLYRDAVKRKMAAYHRHIQLGLIAQGLLQYLSCTRSDIVWKQFGSWLRTIRPGVAPSEQVTAMALKNSLPEFLADDLNEQNFKKFLYERIDITRAEGLRLAA